MRVKILRSTVASGKRVEKGETPDLSDKDAKLLIALKKAAPISEVKNSKNNVTS